MERNLNLRERFSRYWNLSVQFIYRFLMFKPACIKSNELRWFLMIARRKLSITNVINIDFKKKGFRIQGNRHWDSLYGLVSAIIHAHLCVELNTFLPQHCSLHLLRGIFSLPFLFFRNDITISPVFWNNAYRDFFFFFALGFFPFWKERLSRIFNH